MPKKSFSACLKIVSACLKIGFCETKKSISCVTCNLNIFPAGFSFNMKAKLTLKIEADTMPDPTNIFLIRGKRYGCEKIEATVLDWGLERLMTGYFYEMS